MIELTIFLIIIGTLGTIAGILGIYAISQITDDFLYHRK